MAWEDAIDALSLHPPVDLAELHLRMVKGLRELQPKRKTADVGTSETLVAHNQRTAPRSVTLTPRGAVAVGQSRQPDAQFLYLIAASAVTVDIEMRMA